MPPVLGAIGTAVGIASKAKGIGDTLGGLFGGGQQPTGGGIQAAIYNQQLRRAQEAEQQLMKETGEAPEELKDYQQQLTEGIAPAQTQELKAATLAGKKAGVRGGQLATITGRRVGETTQALQKDLTQKLYEDAVRRRQSRTGFLTTKAGQLPQLG